MAELGSAAPTSGGVSKATSGYAHFLMKISTTSCIFGLTHSRRLAAGISCRGLWDVRSKENLSLKF